MNSAFISSLLPSMMEGMVTSLSIFFLTLLISLPLGVVAAAGRMSRYKLIRWPVQAYLLIMRGTPLMLQLFFFYFGPYFILGLAPMDRFWAAILTFGLNYTAYFAEIFRGGIEGVDSGQREAASALGLSKWQTFTRIVFPQALKRSLPPIGNELMTLVKDTALARVIAVAELFDVAAKAANSFVSVMPYIMAAVFYLAMNFLVGQVVLASERKLSYY